jgi:hypothetical protein
MVEDEDVVLTGFSTIKLHAVTPGEPSSVKISTKQVFFVPKAAMVQPRSLCRNGRKTMPGAREPTSTKK